MEETLKDIFGKDTTNELIVRFLPHAVEVNQEDSKGIKKTKLVDYLNFFQTINRNIALTTGLMAPGIRYLSRSKGNTYILLEEPPSIRELRVRYSRRNDDGNIYRKKVPMPGLLFGIQIKEGEGLKNISVWALAKPIRELRDPVYCFPLGNSYGANGHFCWGSTIEHWNNIKEVFQVRSVLSFMINSIFNEDLGVKINIPEEFAGQLTSKIQDLYSFLANQDEFPAKLLSSCGTVKSCIDYLEMRN